MSKQTPHSFFNRFPHSSLFSSDEVSFQNRQPDSFPLLALIHWDKDGLFKEHFSSEHFSFCAFIVKGEARSWDAGRLAPGFLES